MKLTLKINEGIYDSTGKAKAPKPVSVDDHITVTVTHSCSNEPVEIKAPGHWQVVDGSLTGTGSTTAKIMYILPGEMDIIGHCESENPSDVTGSILVVLVVIEHVARGAGLPDSVTRDQPTDVTVSIIPSLDGTGHDMEFDVRHGGGNKGNATLPPNTTRTDSGTIPITGTAQNAPGNTGRLKIRARMDGKGKTWTESPGFGVCAHPSRVRNGPASDYTSATEAGMEVAVTVFSDSATISHIDRVRARERLSSTHTHQGSMVGETVLLATSAWFWATTVPPDDHYLLKASVISAVDKTPGGGNGSFQYDQLEVFECKRCGGPLQAIPNSGFRITHELVGSAGNPITLNTSKQGTAVSFGGNSSAAGSTTPVTPLTGSAPVRP